jgi:hypothetical protein
LGLVQDIHQEHIRDIRNQLGGWREVLGAYLLVAVWESNPGGRLDNPIVVGVGQDLNPHRDGRSDGSIVALELKVLEPHQDGQLDDSIAAGVVQGLILHRDDQSGDSTAALMFQGLDHHQDGVSRMIPLWLWLFRD